MICMFMTIWSCYVEDRKLACRQVSGYLTHQGDHGMAGGDHGDKVCTHDIKIL